MPPKGSLGGSPGRSFLKGHGDVSKGRKTLETKKNKKKN